MPDRVSERGPFRLGLDTGGTFTDVVALDESSGQVHVTKTPTTPADPSVGFMNGVRKSMDRSHADFSADELAAICHGTTIATNALLQEEFPGLGLIVTRGFGDLLEIARQSVPQGYGNSYFWVKPERIVPRHHVLEVGERLTFRGEVLQPLDLEDAERAAAWLRDQRIDCVGVCFLHAYADGAHERQMREVLRRVHPAAAVSISSEVLPEYREYERAMTTLVDAFVKPRVGQYVGRIQEAIDREVAKGTPFYIMKSNGGIISAREVAEQPIATILSGPAAGALGAAALASAAGFDRILTLDGGGTSTDVCLVEHGAPHLTTEGKVGRFPVKVPMIDIVTVGTGGGSVAWQAQDGALKVGPKSAGADPGPMCYGRGGQEPTITDATLVLNRLPSHLLGGEMPLDRSLAERGLNALAERAGMSSSRLAEGILEIAAWSQANAIRQVSIRRGLDVRDYVLVAFGGSGPLLAGKLLDVLGLKAALIPPAPGNVSALGLLTVDVKNDYVLTRVQRDESLDLAGTEEAYAGLERQAVEGLRREGFADEEIVLVRQADLRYFGQAAEVRIDVPAGPLDRQKADEAVQRFHTAHERLYGYSYRQADEQGAKLANQRVEWVNVRVTGVGPIERPRFPRLPAGDGRPEARASRGTRQVSFDGGLLDTAVWDRALLQPGDRLDGPCIVEEFGSTTVVFPTLVADVDDYGNLVMTKSAVASRTSPVGSQGA